MNNHGDFSLANATAKLLLAVMVGWLYGSGTVLLALVAIPVLGLV